MLRESLMITIRNEFSEAKIIILTSYASDVQGAMNLGARAYLRKTQLDKELQGTIRTVYSGIKRFARQHLSPPLRCAHGDGSWITRHSEGDP